jgi:hypothetical protein
MLKKILSFILITSIVGFYVLSPTPVHAEASSFTVNETFDSSCNGSANGQPADYDYVNNGDTVNLTINNTSSYTIKVDSKETTPVIVAPGASTNMAVTVNAESEVDASTSSGCIGSGGAPAVLYIAGANGSLGCSVSDGKVWNVTGQFNDLPMTIALYRGSTYLVPIQASKGGGEIFDSSVNEQFSGQSSAITYYLYDGTSSSDELIGQATCPAIQVASAPASTSPSSKPTTSKATTTPTTSTPTTTAPTTTTTQTPVASNPTVENQQLSSPVKKTAAKNVSHNNTSLLITGSVVLLLLVILLILNLLNIWTLPKQILFRLFHRKKNLDDTKPADDTIENPPLR